MAERWRIALIDSGVTAAAGLSVAGARSFIDGESSPVGDATGHGTAIAEIIHASGKEIDWFIGQVFDARSRSTPASIAAAVSWALSQRVDLIHLSLGLQHDRRVFADAVSEALSASVVVVASSPAQGAITYPAAYPDVIRATGDARCRPDEISALSTRQADYGACAQHQTYSGRVLRGASIGAAHVSRFIVRHAAPGTGVADLRHLLHRLAAYRGPEKRVG
jgi:subtilisin family serine protease